MTDHYLLMTATPHKGDPTNFCLFLELLDRGRLRRRSQSGRGHARNGAPSTCGMLIFTEHKDTLDYLAADGKEGRPLGKLRQWGLSVTQIHGGMKIGDRDTPGTRIYAEKEFRDEAQVLVATEAAGAGAVAVVREQGVQRVQSDQGDAPFRAASAEEKSLERGEVADALVAAGTQRIQMRRDAEAALAGPQRGRQVAAMRRDRQMAEYRSGRSSFSRRWRPMGCGGRTTVPVYRREALAAAVLAQQGDPCGPWRAELDLDGFVHAAE